MRFFDTHAHLQELDEQTFNTVINEPDFRFISPAIYLEDFEKIAKLATLYPDKVTPAFGIHPWHIKNYQNPLEKVEEYIKLFPSALVGETGLDRYRNPENEEIQKELFLQHIELAKKYSRPLIMHSVKAVPWLEEMWDKLPPKFVFHSYNARRELLKKVIAHGGYVSFSSAFLRNREKDKILPAVPLDRLLLETDSPFQSSSPLDIKNIAQEISNILQQDITEIVYNNALEFIK